MPSPAQRKGRAILDALVPRGMTGPDATIRARRDGGRDLIAISVMPHIDSGSGGEYRTTVLLSEHGGEHETAARSLLIHKVARWVEVETMAAAIRDETRACDEDDEGNWVEDDMPTPARRFHCPLPLRTACDRLGMDGSTRVDLVERGGTIETDGYRLRVHEVEGRERAPWGATGRGARTVRRITIEREGFLYSQGVNRCYLRVRADVPATAEAAAMGLPLNRLVHVPDLGSDCIQPVKRGRRLSGGWNEYEMTRCFAMLAGTEATGG